MEKYFRIVNLLIPNQLELDQMKLRLSKINEQPEIYIKDNSRMITKSDDYLWLAMVDLLIDNGYAFEIDWKENCKTAEDCINNLFKKYKIFLELHIDVDEETDPEEFFRIANRELEKLGNYRIYLIDINSDSYVFTVGKLDSVQELQFLDKRISIF
ncbi:DUF6630 family protein [Chryseobacterium vrystaatense]|uniref:DUF6630 domain-containing protein n=1 Tax=Chryseobacterium vrystaatense TaxID=307480 RepID=A0A1M5NV01_9FLAO|nr:DUF6630 family protein [Chryseobacterium vrystaatense]SHG93361.1 hypothetical protein SAMN02787073_5089 [Chryseobacterium vrystaatense]